MDVRLDIPILHVDMDAFFVEVERRRRPELRGKPVVVGGTGPRAVVASASYEARRRGVHSAMPMSEARRRCPGALVVPPDHSAYRDVSKEVFAVFADFTPHVEPLSVDEAFLDISGLRLHFRDAADVAAGIKAALRDRLALPASVGGSTTKFIAKLASQDAKPDGIKIVPRGGETAFLHPMPVRRLWGVGEATLAGLEAMGIETVADLAATPPGALQARLGGSLGLHLARLARGEDDRSVEARSSAKSVSVEETYDEDLHDEAVQEEALYALCHRLARRLEAAGLAGHTITVKIRLADFTTITRSVTRRGSFRAAALIWDAARDLFRQVERGSGVRLLGVGVSALTPGVDEGQLTMEDPRRDDIEQAARRIRRRFGDHAVIPARLIDGAGRGSGGRPEEGNRP